MIILYEKNERHFTSLGLGVLRDALSCGVSEGLNDAYELEMEYPIDGLHFNKIILQRIIFAKPNQYDNPQPFRIYNITKPLNGIITINAEHISYDMSGYTVKPFDAIDLEDTLQKNSKWKYFTITIYVSYGYDSSSFNENKNSI